MSAVLATSFAVVGNVYAANQDGSGVPAKKDVVQTQTQTENKGVESEISVQNGNVKSPAGVGAGTQVEQRMQDGSGIANQNRVQNEAGAPGQGKQEGGNAQGKSVVANAVQEILQIAQRNGGIGQQIRVIAQTQTQNQEKLEAGLKKVQDRSGLVKFLVGPQYSEINNTKKVLEQNREQLKNLNQIKNQLSNQSDQEKLKEQISLIEQSNLEIETTLNDSQKGVSLLGWAFRLFAN
ncbi:MAG: hypothetical protein UR99_C0062G0002 [Candidatus Moranbacteria bacterium GW2011_GWD2_36_12]|nr:MAG: hypothetical protein UR99_C0062G0002 [Candidatus Moranbacteria bacterium GW2011_GWD2_36_12]